jgi:hypothetical protein
MVTNKDKLFAVNLILILISCLNDEFVTIHNKCSKIPPSTSANFANRVRRSGVVRQQRPKCKRPIRSFCKRRSSTSSTNKNPTDSNAIFKQLYLGDQSELDICSYELFSNNNRYYHLPNIELSFWITMYNEYTRVLATRQSRFDFPKRLQIYLP